jgi:hypothetical protein
VDLALRRCGHQANIEAATGAMGICSRNLRLGGAFGTGTVSDKLQTAHLTDDPRLLSLTPRTSSPQCCGFPNCTCGTGVSAKSAIPAPRWRSPSWVRRPSSGTLVEAYKYLESNAGGGCDHCP